MSPRLSPALLRMLDANANRAREGLRVVEDYARFVLNDSALQAVLKSIRHDLTTALKPYLGDAILHRDTPGDVGTANKTTAEGQRENIADLVTAAGKRLGEALRVIEEVLKTDNPDLGDHPKAAMLEPRLAGVNARFVEMIRYHWYLVEKSVALTLRPAKLFAHVKLYVLITESICSRPWFESAEQAIAGGADCIQLREKDLDGGEFLSRAKKIVALCRAKNVLCLINDRPDIALLSDADGVHLGQGDLPARDVRKLLGSEKIIGVSTHDLAHARQAVLDGADYIGVGPVFCSSTKPRDFLPGLDFACQAAAEISIPAVAIAGITLDNVDQVIATGVQAVAVTAAVVGAKDIAAAARQFKAKMSRR